MRTTRQFSLVTLCIGILLVVGACSAGGGSPVTANPGPDLTNYAASVEGTVHQGGSPVTTGHVYIYDLETLTLYNEAQIGSNGQYIAGVDAGQYLVFAFGPTGWRSPAIETGFSTYVNVEAGNPYRMDIELDRLLPDGEELIFGFVVSSENEKAIVRATIRAAGKSTTSDGYGFYAMTVPTGTGNFNISAEGFFDLTENIREGQAADDYFSTPFFMLNPKDIVGASMGGHVRDVATGEGLGGVRITLERPDDPDWAPIQYLTNLGGEYRFFNLPEGIYKVFFERPGYHGSIREGLVLREQDDCIINEFLHRDKQGLADVWGYVMNASIPFPVSGARVSASNPLLGSKAVLTQPNGYYKIENMVPADYTIRVSTPGEAVSYYESVSTFHTLVPGDNQVDFSLRFINEGALRGTVTIDDAGGLFPWAPTGVEITAEKIGGPFTGIKWKTTTDGRGIYVFNGLPVGFYLVKGSAEYAPDQIFYGALEGVFVGAGQTTVADLALALE